MTEAASGPRSLSEVPTVQNTVRFYEQILSQGYGDDDLRRARAACAVAQRLFAGRMHASGKPFLAHCIGTAGILAVAGGVADSTPPPQTNRRDAGVTRPYPPVDLIAAGLVHDAYGAGDFGPWMPSRSLRQRWLRRTLGERAEAYVRRCHELRWDAAAVGELRHRAPQDPVDRGVVLIHLACELDELRDRGALYCADAEARQGRIGQLGPALVEIAATLGVPVLSTALQGAVTETLSSEVPAELRSRAGQTPLFPPASAKRRLEAAVIGALAGGAKRPGDERAP